MHPSSTPLVAAAMTGLASIGALGCAQGPSPTPKRHAPADAIPTSVSVPAASLTEATWQSRLQQQTNVSAFRLSQTPTTVAEYRRCVQDGSCTPPSSRVGTCARITGIDGATYDVDGGDSLPVTCVTTEQATAFCSWVGGRLPSPAEWLLAARGPSNKRYAWGDGLSDCAYTARARYTTSTSCCADGCNRLQEFQVAQHPKGTSAYGVMDVLLTHAELIGAEPNGPFPACAVPAKSCMVSGLEGAAIDQIVPSPESGWVNQVSETMAAVGFRCVWEGVKE